VDVSVCSLESNPNIVDAVVCLELKIVSKDGGIKSIQPELDLLDVANESSFELNSNKARIR
jgi:hypothetical protein